MEIILVIVGVALVAIGATLCYVGRKPKQHFVGR